MFENYVNYAGSKTRFRQLGLNCLFENYVNYAGSKTTITVRTTTDSLRTM